LAEYFTLPERCLYEVPAAIADDRAVFCEPLAAAAHVLDAAEAAGREAVVLGDGKLGLLVALVLAHTKARVTLVGHHPDHLALGAAAGVRTLFESELDARTERVGLVVEATGNPHGLERALALVEPRGTVVLKTTLARPFEADLSRAVIDEVTLVGSRCGNLEVALDLLGRGAVDPAPLVAARYPLAQADRALEHAARPGVLKVLVEGP
jgi:threonine dehydrogenase-like Zn-dependent dehydrogenase